VKGGKMTEKDQKIDVGSFEIMKYEVSNATYASFLNAEKISRNGICKGILIINVSSEDLQLEYKGGVWIPKSGKENYPMVMVSYYGANEFCKWMGGRLPTETEWIYAAKGGRKSNNYIYSGSNNLDEVGWYKGNCEGHSHEVGKKKPNELGIYDMSGNAWEWCRNDSLKSDQDFCVHMGGSWYPGEQPSQITAHYGNIPTHFSNSVGFRVIFPVNK
jgi:formylglycine-generating enzyme required for sulfatase activity